MEPSGPTPGGQPDIYRELARGRVRAALFGAAVGAGAGAEQDPQGGSGPDALYVGRYRIEGSLGEGGMGTVLLARDETLDREVALKVLHSGQGDARRLRREAQALARLSHPNVVQVFEVGEHEGQLFIAMERVRGQTLRQWQRTTRPWQQCVELYVQAGRGLAAAHAQELVHRDFKPANCIVDESGRVRVLDFGLAREVDMLPSDRGSQRRRSAGASPSATLSSTERTPKDSALGVHPSASDGDVLRESVTRSGAMVGTIAYMSPEQWDGAAVGPWSDQFAFCVSLHEALYGVRPFGGESAGSLMVAVCEGTVSAVPSTEVPAALLAIVRRGLRPRPEDRWPSMEALLDALEARLRPRRRWWWIFVSVAAVSTTALALWRWPKASATDCTQASEQLVGRWDDTRREEVEAAFGAAGVGYAGQTWPRVERRLDAYADRWIAMHRAACEATRGSAGDEQSEQQLDLRMRCLGGRRTALGEAVDVLADADGRVVQRAVQLVESLPSLDRCDDLTALAAELPPPEDPALAATVLTLRERLAEADALSRAGRLDAGFAIADDVTTEAAATGYGPIHAEALLHRSMLLREQGKPAPARADAEQAYMLARAEAHDVVAAQAAVQLVYVIGRHLNDLDEAIRWSRLAEGLAASEDLRLRIELRRMVGLVQFEHGFVDEARAELARGLALLDGGSRPMPILRIELLVSLATVSLRQGQVEYAEQVVEEVLSITRRTLGPTHPRVAKLLVNRAMRLHHEGLYERAREDYELALSILEPALGDTHPAVAITLTNLGNTLERMGRYEDALARHERSYRIREQTLGAEHPQTAESLLGQGIALSSLRRYAEAETTLTRAQKILHRSYGPEHFGLASALSSLGLAQGHLGKHDEAEANLRTALSITQRSMGPRHMQVASILVGIASQQRSRGDTDGARASLDDALEIMAESLPPEHPHIALALLDKVHLELAEGRRQQARPLAERAMAIAESGTMGPEEVAEIRLGLAEVIVDTEPRRARALAEQAAAEYRSAGSDGVDDPAARWLSAHPG